jgi:hypothetical protein
MEPSPGNSRHFFTYHRTDPHRDEVVVATATCIRSRGELLGLVAMRAIGSAPGNIGQAGHARRHHADATRRNKARAVIAHTTRELTHDLVDQQVPRW